MQEEGFVIEILGKYYMPTGRTAGMPKAILNQETKVVCIRLQQGVIG